MERIGTIVQLQIQTASLKVGEMPRRYDPAALLSLGAVTVTSEGVSGQHEDGSAIVDVHHTRHPQSKNRGGANGVSLGFTSHYRAMRERFGDHLADGIAGENILIETDHRFQDDDLAGGIVIAAGSGARLMLRPVIAAAPCVEFARYALRFPADARPDGTVTEVLRFLGAGMRGFYVANGGEPAVVTLGDQVLSARPRPKP